MNKFKKFIPLKGHSYDLIFIDECAIVPMNVWEKLKKVKVPCVHYQKGKKEKTICPICQELKRRR